MAIEDDFYATIKLNSGEEVFAKVAASEEEDRAIKEKYKKQGIWPAGNSKQRRGRLNKVENENRTSILEGLEKNIGTKGSGDLINKPVSAQRKPRRGRGRSWRDK